MLLIYELLQASDGQGGELEKRLQWINSLMAGQSGFVGATVYASRGSAEKKLNVRFWRDEASHRRWTRTAAAAAYPGTRPPGLYAAQPTAIHALVDAPLSPVDLGTVVVRRAGGPSLGRSRADSPVGDGPVAALVHRFANGTSVQIAPGAETPAVGLEFFADDEAFVRGGGAEDEESPFTAGPDDVFDLVATTTAVGAASERRPSTGGG